MSHRIIPRAEWGARPARNRTQVAASRRKYFTLHYDSEQPRTATGNSVPRGIQNFHMDTRGWADIGYNFVIDQAGNIFEGRGWNILGAHAEAAGNAVGIGVQIHIGGDQKPSPAALNAADWLWGQANARFGKRLALAGHRDFTPTSCPGNHLYKIVASGTIPHTPAPGGSTVPLGDTPTPTSPTSGTPTVQEDDMPLNQTDLDAIKQIVDRGRNDVDIANQKRIDAIAEDADLARRVSIANQQRIDRNHATQMGVLSGVVAALQQVSGGEGVDMSQITAAAERGAREGAKQGLEDGLEVTVKPAGKDA